MCKIKVMPTSWSWSHSVLSSFLILPWSSMSKEAIAIIYNNFIVWLKIIYEQPSEKPIIYSYAIYYSNPLLAVLAVLSHNWLQPGLRMHRVVKVGGVETIPSKKLPALVSGKVDVLKYNLRTSFRQLTRIMTDGQLDLLNTDSHTQLITRPDLSALDSMSRLSFSRR